MLKWPALTLLLLLLVAALIMGQQLSNEEMLDIVDAKWKQERRPGANFPAANNHRAEFVRREGAAPTLRSPGSLP